MRECFTKTIPVRRLLFRGALIALSLLLCVSLLACQKKDTGPKQFFSEGMTVTLTGAFEEIESAKYTACYQSDDVAAMFSKEKLTAIGKLANCSLEEYARLLLETNDPAGAVTLQSKDGTFYFERTEKGKDEDYYFFSVVLRSSDAFWLVQFSTKQGLKETYSPLFWDWVNSITFAE